MRTESQIQASRANGARSRGPVTAEGKYNSSRNATRHGLLAGAIVMKGELEERFREVLADLDQELRPETPIEYALVEKMAVARWRQLRVWGMEKAAMEYQVRKQADAIEDEDKPTRASLAFAALGDSRTLDLIIRYDSLCDRQYLRAHRRFMEMRRERGDSPAPSRPQPEVTPRPGAMDLEAPGPADLTSQPASFLPESSEQKDEKQPNEPNNSLQTKQPPAANPAQSRQTRNAGGHSDFWLPTSSAPPSCKIAGCKIDASCHPLNPQDSR
jgi:hypothetical protein